MSRKNKNLRAFLHQNPKPTIEQAWDAAWHGAQKTFHARSMQEARSRIEELRDLVRRIHDELQYGDIVQWDNGSQVWRDMEAEVSGDSCEQWYMLIDMDNGTTAHDRLTRDEAMAKLEEGHYSLMPMKDDDNPEWHCSFCGRKGFALKGGSAHE